MPVGRGSTDPRLVGVPVVAVVEEPSVGVVVAHEGPIVLVGMGVDVLADELALGEIHEGGVGAPVQALAPEAAEDQRDPADRLPIVPAVTAWSEYQLGSAALAATNSSNRL